MGWLFNDKMLMGVVVVLSMNYGGLFLVMGYLGFMVVGLLVSISCFVMLECYDNVCEYWLLMELWD